MDVKSNTDKLCIIGADSSAKPHCYRPVRLKIGA